MQQGFCAELVHVCNVVCCLSLILIKGSLGGETSVLRTFRMSGKEFVKERVSEGKS